MVDCDPALESWRWEDHVFGASFRYNVTLSQNKICKDREYSSTVRYLPTIYKALGSILHIIQKHRNNFSKTAQLIPLVCEHATFLGPLGSL